MDYWDSLIKAAELLFLVTAIITMTAFGFLIMSLAEEVREKRRRFRNLWRKADAYWRDSSTDFRG